MNDGKTLYVRLAAHLGDLNAGLAKGSAMIQTYGNKADAQMVRLEKFAKKNQKELRALGTVAGGVGLAAGVGIGLAVRKFAEFDKQMSAVQAATHAGTNEMAALRAEAIKLGADTQFSAVEAAQGIEELAKAGISSADILGGGLKGALDLAAAGALGVGESAEIAATALTQFDLKGKDLPHLADLLAAGAGKAQGSVSDLGSALGQTGLVASNMGLSIEDTTGTLAAFAKAGLIGSDAGTSFKTMIQRLQAPMGRGAKAMEKYGISAYDTQGNFVGITEVAGQLQTKLAGLTQQQRDAALAQIFGADAIRAATVLYKQGATGMQGWIDKTNDAGYAAETARLRTDNLAGDVERLGGSLDSLFIGMGEGANGPMRELVQMLETLVDAGGAMPDWMMSTVTAGLAFTAALGLAVFAATRLTGAIGSTRAGIALLKTQTVSAAESLYLMDKAMLLKNVGKGAAMMGGLAIASGAAGDAFGLSNTAAFALMGTMAGPLGVASGAAVGFLMDVTAANDGMWASFNKAQESVGGATTFRGQIKALEDLEKAQIHYSDVSVLSLGGMKEGFKGIFGDNSMQQTAKRVEEARKAVMQYQGSIAMLQDQTVGAKDGINKMFDPKEAQQFADTIGPVLEKAGLSLDEILKEGPTGDKWGMATAAIREWKFETETAEGRAKSVTDVLGGMGGELSTVAGDAGKLAKALDGLFSPTMDMDAAIQKWRDGLSSLRGELAQNGTSIDNNSVKSRANRAAIREQVDALTDMMSASAAAGEGSDVIAQQMEDGRAKIIAQAEAAGINAGAMGRLLDYYNLTPDLVESVIKATGAGNAVSETGKLNTNLDTLDGKTATSNVIVKGNFWSAVDKLRELGNLIDAAARKGSPSVPGGKGKNQSGGGYYPNGIPAAANGLYNEAHAARAGVRVIRYAEQETQGETFIPHALNKRKRSTKYLGMTAAKFGYDLTPRGMSSARGNTTVIQQAGQGPLIGSVTLGSGPRREVRSSLDELEKTVRKFKRGGRSW